jgi:hypothetical protein
VKCPEKVREAYMERLRDVVLLKATELTQIGASRDPQALIEAVAADLPEAFQMAVDGGFIEWDE